jgi:hypothetical protein
MGDSAGDSLIDGARANGLPARPRSVDDVDPLCRRLLEETGFSYDGRTGAWSNLPGGRVITLERVAERSPAWLAAWLAGG